MSSERQISAYISEDTKVLIERYAKASGMKKGHLIEQALLHHMQALREIPADIIIPPRLIVSRRTGDRILERIANPPTPTTAMKDLFRKKRKDSS